jgi:hypothetical protein
MLSKGTILLAQVIDLVDRATFASIVHRHGAGRCSKVFGSWDQSVSMMLSQLGKSQSLREIRSGFATSQGRLHDLGLKTSPKRSTLAHVNEHRPWGVFEDPTGQRNRETA